MRDVLLLAGFVLCAAIGAVTVLWPEVASHDDTPASIGGAPTPLAPQSSPQAAVP
jgi:hypothetical protein